MTGRKGEALDENEAVAAIADAVTAAVLGLTEDQAFAIFSALNDADVVLVWDGPAEVWENDWREIR